MSKVRKIKMNVMDIGRFMDEAPFDHVQCALDNLMYAASTNTKSKVLDVEYDGAVYKFEQEGKTIRRDCLEITYRYV